MQNRLRSRWIGPLVLLIPVAFCATRSQSHARDEALPADSYRLEVKEILRNDDVRAVEVSIEARAEAWVEVKSDQPDRGGVGTQVVGDRKGGESRSRVRLVILGDHVQANSCNVFKFLMSLSNEASGGATMTNTGPMPPGKRLADVLKVKLASGVYRCGEKIPALAANDVSYSLLVREKSDAGK